MMADRYSFDKSKLRQYGVIGLSWVLLGLWIVYGGWASGVSHDTVLMDFVPEFTIYLIVSATVGALLAGLIIWKKPENRSLQKAFGLFGGGFGLTFALVVNSLDIYIYQFPDKVIGYETEYDVVFPGPSRGKHGHCEAGLRFREQHTGKMIELCTSPEAIRSQRKQGMTGIWVTARVNRLGSYIVRYEFVYL